MIADLPTMTNISQDNGKSNWHRHGTKLRQCRPTYSSGKHLHNFILAVFSDAQSLGA